MKKIIAVALSLLFLLGGVSEAVNLKKSIIGKWFRFYIISEEQLEFLKDGKVILVRGYKSHIGDYRFIDDNRLLVNIDFEEKIYEVSIDKQGQLNLTDPMGNVNRYFTKTEYEKRIAAEKAEQANREAAERAEQTKREAAERAEFEKKIKEKFTISDLTVLDNVTKLMWTRDADIADKEMNWDDAVKFIETLNEQKYGGYSDWRLPSDDELKTLVNFVKEQGYNKNIHKFLNIGFKNVQAASYWSSTDDSTGGVALFVRMDNGEVSSYYKRGNPILFNKLQHIYVLPVRTEQ